MAASELGVRACWEAFRDRVCCGVARREYAVLRFGLDAVARPKRLDFRGGRGRALLPLLLRLLNCDAVGVPVGVVVLLVLAKLLLLFVLAEAVIVYDILAGRSKVLPGGSVSFVYVHHTADGKGPHLRSHHNEEETKTKEKKNRKIQE